MVPPADGARKHVTGIHHIEEEEKEQDVTLRSAVKSGLYSKCLPSALGKDLTLLLHIP